MGNMMKQMGGAGGMKDIMKDLGGGKFPFYAERLTTKKSLNHE
jgi:hypothetical protein